MKLLHEKFMLAALSAARQASAAGEVPIGAVIVCGDEIIASAFNTCEADHDALAHAELKVIREAARFKGNWRLNDCTLYVTLEPCPMCLGALFQARVGKLVFGCFAPQNVGTSALRHIGTSSLTDNNHTLSIVCGVLEKECSEILKLFFKLRRDAL